MVGAADHATDLATSFLPPQVRSDTRSDRRHLATEAMAMATKIHRALHHQRAVTIKSSVTGNGTPIAAIRTTTNRAEIRNVQGCENLIAHQGAWRVGNKASCNWRINWLAALFARVRSRG